MKKSEDEAIILVIFALTALTSAVLTGYERQDINEDPRFGCRWLGGSNPGLECNCREDAEEMYIRDNSISSYDTTTVLIDGCKKVRFGSQSIAEMRNLRALHLRNVQSLEFEESSLKWFGYRDKDQYEERFDMSIPSLKITIENSNVTRIGSHTFEGRINTIYFDGATIQNIDPFAFTALKQTQQIIMKNTELKNVGQQSFKKFSTEHFKLDGVRAQIVPSRFLFNVTVYENFVINNCTFETVRSGGFLVNNPLKFDVTDTTINHIDGEAFKVSTRGDVIFKNNVFGVINDGAFLGITLNTEEIRGGGKTITFDSNNFTTLTRDSLSVSEDFVPKFTNLIINETCDCKNIDRNINDAMFYAEIKCLYNKEFVTIKEYKANWCSLIKSYSTTIIIVGVVLTLCFIIVTLLVVYYRKVHLSKKYGNKKAPPKGNMSLIVPDGRTYRETELHVIVERADLLTTDL